MVYIAIGTDPVGPCRFESDDLSAVEFFAAEEAKNGHAVVIYADPSGKGIADDTTVLRVVHSGARRH